MNSAGAVGWDENPAKKCQDFLKSLLDTLTSPGPDIFAANTKIPLAMEAPVLDTQGSPWTLKSQTQIMKRAKSFWLKVRKPCWLGMPTISVTLSLWLEYFSYLQSNNISYLGWLIDISNPEGFVSRSTRVLDHPGREEHIIPWYLNM